MRIRYVAVVGAIVLGATACGGSAAPHAVKGDRDDVRKIAAVKELSHMEKISSKECARRVGGACKSYRTVTSWKKVVDRKGKAAVHCVKLDNVNGSAKDDDVWYTVRQSDYIKALFKAEDAGLKFIPMHGGCW